MELLEAVGTSFGQILSMFDVSPDIDSYEALYENLSDQIENEECLIYLSLYISALCQSMNIFDTTCLHFSGNLIRKLPSNFSSFSKLEELICSEMYDDETTEKEWDGLLNAIFSITSLKVLHLDSNQLTTLPSTIGNLTNLTDLYLGNNQLTILPESIGELTSLEYLGLSDNQLSTLPASIYHNLSEVL